VALVIMRAFGVILDSARKRPMLGKEQNPTAPLGTPSGFLTRYKL